MIGQQLKQSSVKNGQEQVTQIPYRMQLLQKANPRLPTTAEGLPVGFYRVDLLPETQPETSQEEVQSLRNAYTDLHFEHGYPTFGDGRPFWYKLDYEPSFAYGVFQLFLELGEGEEPRSVAALLENEEVRSLANQIYGSSSSPFSSERGLESSHSVNGGEKESKTAAATDERSPVKRTLTAAALSTLLNEFAVLYLWKSRSRAYDLYREASYRHLKLRRQTTVENEHYLLAQMLMTKLKNKMLDNPSFFDEMSPKVATDLLGKLVAIQRISSGLPAAGPLSQKESPEDVTFEMILRSLGARAAKGHVFDQNGREAATGNALTKVLEDPRAAGMMQEVIIRVSKATLPSEDGESGSEGRNPRGMRFKGRPRQSETIDTEDLSTGYDLNGVPGQVVNGDD